MPKIKMVGERYESIDRFNRQAYRYEVIESGPGLVMRIHLIFIGMLFIKQLRLRTWRWKP
jgi:hypothetical protein